MRALILALLIALPAQAAGKLTEADVRAFVVGQEQAWNGGRLDAYFAGFTPEATFTDQAYQGAKPPVSYGTASLAEARVQTRKAFAKTRPREAGRVVRIEIAPDGRSARVTTSVGIQNGPRRLCATRLQTLVLAQGKLRSRGQTDTYIRCPK